ncbi:MAG: 5-(carboxyamino)imidazole ribonucleotide synthase [Robiginitomaculum sp.]
MTKPAFIAPGGVIGILGGGQLGKMLAVAASRLGLEAHIYAPENDAIARSVACYNTVADYDDLEALAAFAKSCDVVSYEFENVPANTAAIAAKHSKLFPGARALEVAQDRLVEKTFLSKHVGVSVVGFADITGADDVLAFATDYGYPLILKTRRFGYDGKGQVKINDESGIDAALESFNGAPIIAEQFSPFVREVSIVAARSEAGEFAAYPLIENVHNNHILHTSTCPMDDDPMGGDTDASNGEAKNIAKAIMDALDYIGVMATEFFQMEDGSLVVNEIAPRVHNSGHFTQNAGCTDQFEQHIRAIAGWPLGNAVPSHKTVMTNLIGDDVDSWAELAADGVSYLHLYGKGAARPGRKMGHVNRRVNPA